MYEIVKHSEEGTEEYTMKMGIANLISIVMIIPIAVIIVIPFILIWDFARFQNGLEILVDDAIIYFLGGIIVHELLHGLVWACFSPNRFKSIKFGVKWKYLAPYCHCTEPLKVKHYKIGIVMPLIIMGLIPSLIGLIIGHGAIFAFGFIAICVASGDILGLYLLKNLESNAYVSDHPEKIGFIRTLNKV